MFLFIATSLSFAGTPAFVPTANPANTVSAEEAYRLAAEAYGKIGALEKRYRALKVGDPKVAAELEAIGMRVHDMECNAGADDATCPAVPTQTVTITPIEAINSDLLEVATEISRIELLEQREASLVTGAGMYLNLQPPIDGLAGSSWLGAQAIVQSCNEDYYGGFCIGGSAVLASDATYGIGAEYVRYWKGPSGRFAWGYGVLGQADFVHGVGQSQCDAYHGAAGAQGYLRFTVAESEYLPSANHWATDLVVAPMVTVGQVGIDGAAAFEARAGLRIYIQRRSGVGGRVIYYQSNTTPTSAEADEEVVVELEIDPSVGGGPE